MLRHVDLMKGMLIACGLTLGGCSQGLYGETQDPVTLEFGNAVKSNVAMQTIDPWPANAQRVNLTTAGRPMNSAIDRYYTGTILPPVANGTDNSLGGSSKAPQSAAAQTK